MTAACEQIRAHIRELTARLDDLDAELADLATARKVLLALGEDEPTPATHPALPDNPAYQHILTVLTAAETPCATRTCATLWTLAPNRNASRPCAPPRAPGCHRPRRRTSPGLVRDPAPESRQLTHNQRPHPSAKDETDISSQPAR